MMARDEFEAAIAEFSDLLQQMGASPEMQARQVASLREVAALPADDPAKVIRSLASALELLPFVEAEQRSFGNVEFADEIARHAVGLELWLEMPPGLALRAGHPKPEG